MKHAHLGLVGAVAGAVAGALLGVFVAFCLRQLKHWIWPPGPMMMGDLEGLVFGLAGLLIGVGLGGSIGLWYSRRFASDKRCPRAWSCWQQS